MGSGTTHRKEIRDPTTELGVRGVTQVSPGASGAPTRSPVGSNIFPATTGCPACSSRGAHSPRCALGEVRTRRGAHSLWSDSHSLGPPIAAVLSRRGAHSPRCALAQVRTRGGAHSAWSAMRSWGPPIAAVRTRSGAHFPRCALAQVRTRRGAHSSWPDSHSLGPPITAVSTRRGAHSPRCALVEVRTRQGAHLPWSDSRSLGPPIAVVLVRRGVHSRGCALPEVRTRRGAHSPRCVLVVVVPVSVPRSGHRNGPTCRAMGLGSFLVRPAPLVLLLAVGCLVSSFGGRRQLKGPSRGLGPSPRPEDPPRDAICPGVPVPKTAHARAG